MWILIQGILSSEPEPPIDTENEDGDVNETWNQRNLRKGDKDVIEDDRTLASELSSLSTDSSSHDFYCSQLQSLTKSSSSPSIGIKF